MVGLDTVKVPPDWAEGAAVGLDWPRVALGGESPVSEALGCST